MCGIAGIVALSTQNNSHSSAINPEQIVAMCDTMQHRGPDGEGYLYTHPNTDGYLPHLRHARPHAHICHPNHPHNVLFGHRRLAIIDPTAAAAQPMTDATKRLWITFNGEIYNHRSLRTQLVNMGYHFITHHSDTEVILNAYLAWGIECVQKFRGMFAFCIYDTHTHELYLMRDRMGVKPLYYAIHNQILYFASEIKAILANKTIKATMNKPVISDYLSFTAAAAPDTFFENIHKLHAAHYIKINLETADISPQIRYWDMYKNNPINPEETTDDLRNCFIDCVDIRREADVQYGVLLSGGIDSSANAVALSKLVTKPIKAFTVGFSNHIHGYNNEFAPAKQVAKLCNAEHFELELTQKDFMDFLPQMIWHQDEPTADAANIPIYYISKLAKQQGVTVILGGEGSDELLIGYKVMQDAHRFSNFMHQHPNLKKRVLNAAFGINALQKRKSLEYNWLQNLHLSPHFFRTVTDLETEQNKQNYIFAPDFLHQIKHYDPNQKFTNYYNDFTKTNRSHFYDWASYIELNYRLPELLLNRLDKMTMAASVEGRTPFLDVNFVEMAMRTPPHQKIQQNQEKYLLKKALHNLLPHNILHRPKDGFTIPMQHLLANDLLQYTKDIIIDFNKNTGVFQQKYIDYITQPNPNAQVADKLWVALNLAMWWQKFIK